MSRYRRESTLENDFHVTEIRFRIEARSGRKRTVMGGVKWGVG